ncbi:hypothetical protein [Selenomonas sp. oral taxon 920]|nr:hypothetical protein [Selenomonas sp. oral taxon 920]
MVCRSVRLLLQTICAYRLPLLRTTKQIAEELALHGIRSEVDPLMYHQ